jgi:hypothetical protein
VELASALHIPPAVLLGTMMKTCIISVIFLACAQIILCFTHIAELYAQDISATELPTTDERGCLAEFSYHSQLMRAENAYVKRHYESVLLLLSPLLEVPECLQDPTTRLEVELLAGVSYLEQGKDDEADRHFMRVLRLNPDYEIGSIITLPEGSSRRIETLKIRFADELNALRGNQSHGVVVESLYILAEKKENPYWINFLPFGAGQFQMGEKGWGITYASLQASSLALTILGGGMVELYRGKSGKYSKLNYPKAKSWQHAQIAGIAAFSVFYLAGMIHALIIHEDSSAIMHPPSQQRPDVVTHLPAPIVLPDGAGLGYNVLF